MDYRELKELARKVDQSEDEEREKLLWKLTKKLPEMDALEGASNQALITGLKLSQKVYSRRNRPLSEKQKWIQENHLNLSLVSICSRQAW